MSTGIANNKRPCVSWRGGQWVASFRGTTANAPHRLIKHGRGKGVTDMGMFDALDALRNARPAIPPGFVVICGH